MNSTSADLAASRDSLSKTTVTAPLDGIVTALPDQGGRGHGHRHDEQRRHAAADDLRHVRGRGGDDGRRDVRAAGQDRPEGRASRSTPTRTASSRGRSRRSAPRRSRRTIPDLLSLTANSEAINFKVKIRLDNPPDTIRPGFSVTADIVTGTKRRRDGDSDPGARRARRPDEGRRSAVGRGAARRPKRASTSSRTASSASRRSRPGIAGELMIEVKKGAGRRRRDRHRALQGPAPGQGRRQGRHREGRRRRQEGRVRNPRDDLGALPRLVVGADAAQAARVPDAARRHHRRRDRRRRRLGDLGPEHLRQGQDHRAEPRHRHLHQVRDHHEPRGVAASRRKRQRPHADRHGDRAPRVQALRGRSAARGERNRPRQVRGPQALATSRSRGTRRTWARR